MLAGAGLGGVVEGALVAVHGGEVAFVLRTIRNRKVGTAQDAQDDLAILNQGESNGVLVEPEEALGSVDRVEGPVTAFATAVVGPPVDGGENGVLGQLGEDGLDAGDDAVLEPAVLALAQCLGVLLSHERDGREGLTQHVGDDGLCGEVGHGDRGLVALLQGGAGDETGLDLLADTAGGDDGFDGDLALRGEEHGRLHEEEGTGRGS